MGERTVITILKTVDCAGEDVALTVDPDGITWLDVAGSKAQLDADSAAALGSALTRLADVISWRSRDEHLGQTID